jgi:biopolymer transport protein ExbB/TolQ
MQARGRSLFRSTSGDQAMIGDFDATAMFLQAGPVVRAVAILLGVMSLWCWAIVVNASIGLFKVKAAVRALERDPTSAVPIPPVKSGFEEAARGFSDETLAERRDRIQGSMRRQAQAFVERSQGNLGSLAVIASVAPFVGLFGTVWGIMTSFIGIAAAKDTSLAVVAPGIAEALAATALGLTAAIPAAFAYNRLVAAFGKSSRRLTRGIDALVPDIAAATADNHAQPREVA